MNQQPIKFSTNNRVALLCKACVGVLLLGCTTALSATNNKATQTIYTQNRSVQRVSDPWSKTTVWADQYEQDCLNQTEIQNGDGADVLTFHFRVSSIVFEKEYMDNARSIAIIEGIFADVETFNRFHVTVITGTASPEGPEAFNQELAANRARAIKSYIMWKHPNLDRDRISTYSGGENWVGLKRMITQDLHVPARKELLHILSLHISDHQKLARIKILNKGKTYRYLETNLFPSLRGSVSCTFYTLNGERWEASQTQDGLVMVQEPVVERVRVDTIYIDRYHEVIKTTNQTPIMDQTGDNKHSKPHFMALKTNVLYELALLPNLAIECSLGNRWSVEAEGMWSWWSTSDNTRYYHRIQTVGLEVRKWLGSPSTPTFTGHYFGLYGMGGTYDIKFNQDKGALSDWSHSFGVSYGYAKPLSKRLNLEFSVGAGYMSGKYKTYTFDENHDRYPLKERLIRNYVGPTKAKISLVWLIGNGVNKQTGNR